jgi:hypothetical protein
MKGIFTMRRFRESRYDNLYRLNRSSNRRIYEGDASKKTNYAVQVRDMNKGYIHLFTGTKNDCLKLERILDDFTDEMKNLQDEYEYEANMNWLFDEVLSNYGHVAEISYRDIDSNNNYWDYDQPYHIINDYYFDLYL